MARIRVDILDANADAHELDDFTRSLRVDLLQLDVDDVTQVSSEGLNPAGARAIDATTLGALLITFNNSLPLATAVIDTIQDWLKRSTPPSTKSVRVIVGDKSIKLDGASNEQQDRLVQAFIGALPRGSDR